MVPGYPSLLSTNKSNGSTMSLVSTMSTSSSRAWMPLPAMSPLYTRPRLRLLLARTRSRRYDWIWKLQTTPSILIRANQESAMFLGQDMSIDSKPNTSICREQIGAIVWRPSAHLVIWPAQLHRSPQCVVTSFTSVCMLNRTPRPRRLASK